MLDFGLIAVLGFLGSFGHCIGMCGPLAIAFAITKEKCETATWQRQLKFHLLLNLGRLTSYGLVGAAIGAVGSVMVAGGQVAGIDSDIRRALAIATGLLLIWMGLRQVAPKSLPQLPFIHPLLQKQLHERLFSAMAGVSHQVDGWTPLALGLMWGLIPCGFLYVAQTKAAETGNLQQGMLTMLAFGLGTLPAMVSMGVASTRLSRDRRSQLFRLGGWLTLAIGLLTLFRSDEMHDLTGHTALLLLMLALIARPIHRLWAAPLRYRRVIGVSAFVLSVAHMLHSFDHTFNWQWQALGFMLLLHQVAIWLGIISLLLLLPAASTSFDSIAQQLGHRWRWLHLLTIPALVLAATHAILVGSSYLGSLQWTATQKILSGVLVGGVILVLLSRDRRCWSFFSLEHLYTSAKQPKLTKSETTSPQDEAF
jgi:hypothetical protein